MWRAQRGGRVHPARIGLVPGQVIRSLVGSAAPIRPGHPQRIDQPNQLAGVSVLPRSQPVARFRPRPSQLVCSFVVSRPRDRPSACWRLAQIDGSPPCGPGGVLSPGMTLESSWAAQSGSPAASPWVRRASGPGEGRPTASGGSAQPAYSRRGRGRTGTAAQVHGLKGAGPTSRVGARGWPSAKRALGRTPGGRSGGAAGGRGRAAGVSTPTGDRDLHGCWAACRR
jgi:hypothetical protein